MSFTLQALQAISSMLCCQDTPAKPAPKDTPIPDYTVSTLSTAVPIAFGQCPVPTEFHIHGQQEHQVNDRGRDHDNSRRDSQYDRDNRDYEKGERANQPDRPSGYDQRQMERMATDFSAPDYDVSDVVAMVIDATFAQDIA